MLNVSMTFSTRIIITFQLLWSWSVLWSKIMIPRNFMGGRSQSRESFCHQIKLLERSHLILLLQQNSTTVGWKWKANTWKIVQNCIIALKGHPFTHFQDQIDHLIKIKWSLNYTGGTKRKMHVKTYCFGSVNIFLTKAKLEKKLEVVNFVAILCDSSADTSITEQEVEYIVFVDPKSGKAFLLYYEVFAHLIAIISLV